MDAREDGKAALTAPVVDHMFAEAMELLEGAQALARLATVRKPSATSTAAQTVAMRLTTRLANSVSWLLAAKAVNAGEITAQQMARDFALNKGAAQRVSLEEQGLDDPDLHPGLRALSAASLALYRRLARLDELLGRVAQA